MRGVIKALTICFAILLSNMVSAQNNSWEPKVGINLSGLANTIIFRKSLGLETTFEYLRNKKHGPVLNLLYSRDIALRNAPLEIQNWATNTWIICAGYTFSNYKPNKFKSYSKFTILAGYYQAKANGMLVIPNQFYHDNFLRQPFEQSIDSYIIEGKVSNYWRLSNKFGLDFGAIVGWTDNITNISGWNLETPPVVNNQIGPVHFRIQCGIWFLPKENKQNSSQ